MQNMSFYLQRWEIVGTVYGRFDTKSFRYKSFRYACKVVSIHM